MDISGLDAFSVEDEIKYISEYKRTKSVELRDFIINSNIKLVNYFMKLYVRCSPSDYDDYFQEGCIALITALDRFDLSMGYRFSTYACWWLKQAFQRYRFKTFSPLHIPTHICEELNKIYKHELQDSITGVTTNLSEVLNRDDEHINYIKTVTNVTSLNQLLRTDDADTELEDMICSEEEPIDYELHRKEIRELLLKAFDTVSLNNQERDVILKRFGFYDGDFWTLQAIANTYNFSRERIRQIETTALRKLRGSYKVKLLFKGYEEGTIC